MAASAPAPAVPADRRIKAVLLGNAGVGKTALLIRRDSGRWDADATVTIGVDFMTTHVQIAREAAGGGGGGGGGASDEFAVTAWDTSGQERFHTVAHTAIRGAHVVLLCYAHDDPESFEAVPTWLKAVRERVHSQDQAPVIMLICTKADLEACDTPVSRDEARRLAEKEGIRFLATSARSGANVDQAFVSSAEEAVRIRRDRTRTATREMDQGAGVVVVGDAAGEKRAPARKRGMC